jgi:ribokinase
LIEVLVTIAVAGGYGIGMTMRVASSPRPGETVTDGTLAIGHGGKGSNQAVAARRLGTDVALFSAVGPDGHGAAAREFWATERVDGATVMELHSATMCGFIIVDAAGENRIAIAPGALAEITEQHAERFRPSISRADLLVVSLEIPLIAAIALLRIAKEERTRTLLNPAPAAHIPRDVWPLVDYLTPNETEAAELLGDHEASSDLPHTAAKLHDLTGAVVVLTAGDRGVAAHGVGDAFQIEAVHVDTVRDTTGAGDAFTAALAVALVEGAPLRAAVEFAAAAGAHAVTIDGAVPGFATRSELESFILEHAAQGVHRD